MNINEHQYLSMNINKDWTISRIYIYFGFFILGFCESCRTISKIVSTISKIVRTISKIVKTISKIVRTISKIAKLFLKLSQLFLKSSILIQKFQDYF